MPKISIAGIGGAGIDRQAKATILVDDTVSRKQGRWSVGQRRRGSLPATCNKGEARRRLGSLTDLSAGIEALQDHQRLLTENERLQMALSGSGIVGLWDWMVDTNLLHGDAQFARLYGLDVAATAAGLTEAAYQQHVVAEDLASLRTRIRDVFDRGAEFLVEYRLAIPGEALRWVECRGQMIADAAGRPVRFSGTAIDITERHRSEVALKHLNDTLEQRVAERTDELNFFWDSSPDLLLMIDFHGVFRRVNPAWTTLLGYAPDEVVGHHVNEFVFGDDHAEAVDAYELAANGGMPRVVNRYRHKDGSLRWISWVAAPRGSMTYATGRDVTAEREHAAALANTEEALRQAQKMEAVGQLTGGLAHDFNNLLAGISGSLELMGVRISQGRIKDVERYMIAAQGAAKRAAALTHRLLAFSRRQTLAPKVTDVNALIDGMLDLIQRTVGPGIDVQNVGMGGLWRALVDPSQLENALLNLCINARDAMGDDGRITIETANRWIDRDGSRQYDMPEGQYLSLCVSDTGTGMAADVIAKAFDPFFTTKPIGEGTGLGLSMIYGFAKQSGGQVRIYSEVGEGTNVCIYLPRHHGEAGADEPMAGHAPRPRAEAGETVLVVDDEPTVRMLVTDVLEDLGYTAIEAADGAGGLRVLQSDARIDLLISDIGLPGGMNGRQMADTARAGRPDLKVLFVTGFAENSLLNNGQLDPGMSVLTKPFAVDTLAARIREMISS